MESAIQTSLESMTTPIPPDPPGTPAVIASPPSPPETEEDATLTRAPFHARKPGPPWQGVGSKPQPMPKDSPPWRMHRTTSTRAPLTSKAKPKQRGSPPEISASANVARVCAPVTATVVQLPASRSFSTYATEEAG